MRPARIHNLSGNAREDSPHEVIVIDTETRPADDAGREVHRMRCWSARLTRRHGRNPSRPRQVDADGFTPAELADWVDAAVKADPVCWVYTHNLSFDLAVTALPLELIARGWVLKTHNLASDAPWAHLAHGRRSIHLCDSHSMLPYSAAHIGAHTGVPKVDLPDWEDSDAAWLARCRGDVEIISGALLSLMDWWDQGGYGHFAATGPRTGWNSYRHRCVRRKGGGPVIQRGPLTGGWVQHGDGHVVIDPDPEVRAWERRALYQGRRESFRMGKLPAGTYAELDFKHAYLSAACELPLPCRRGLAFDSLPLESRYVEDSAIGVIASVTVDAKTPRYPWRGKSGICYPVGRFTTVLCGPEIAEARRRGELVAIGAGHYYRLSYHMQPWALWAKEVIEDESAGTPAAARLFVKGASRSVFGVWAARTSATILHGTTTETGWSAEHGTDAATGAPCTILHMAGKWSYILRDRESDDSFPAVLAWVQSHVRVALGAVVDQLPQRALVSCSTDSVLVDLSAADREREDQGEGQPAHLYYPARAKRLCSGLNMFTWPFFIRVKGMYTVVDVLSAQHMVLDGERRYAGIAGSATQQEDGRWKFHTWPKLGRQLQLGEDHAYVREVRVVDLSGMTVNRWTALDGCTEPVRARLDQHGATVLEQPWEGGCARHGSAWRDRQWPDFPQLDSEFWATV